MKLRASLLAAALVLFSGLSGTARAVEALTLTRALELAEKNSPRLKIAATEVDRARSGTTSAKAYPNPEIEALRGGVRARIPGVTSGQGVSVSIGQPIDLPSHREPRIRQAESGLESAQLYAQESLITLRADVKQAFYQVLRRRAEYELSLDNQKLLEQTRHRIEVSVNVGERARFELVRVEAELANAMNQAQSARLRVAQALAQLKLLLGIATDADVDVAGDFVPATIDETLESLYATMQDRHPALRRARVELRRAEYRLQEQRALKVPRPTLFAGVDRDPDQNRTLFGVSIPIPVWDQRQGPVGEAVAGLQQAAVLGEQQRMLLRGELEINYNRLLVARQQIAAYEGGLIRQAENALRVAESAFRFGERGFLEVLDAQRVLRTVRADFLAARFDKQSAIVEIERLIAKDLIGDSK